MRAERRRSNQLEKELRKERLMERLFSEAEGRVGGHFQLGELDGRERLLPVDGKGQPLNADGLALSDGDYMEALRQTCRP
ncbi:MAG: hypothetical protein R6W06_13810 [Prochlorococcaceae cyanobacterium]